MHILSRITFVQFYLCVFFKESITIVNDKVFMTQDDVFVYYTITAFFSVKHIGYDPIDCFFGYVSAYMKSTWVHIFAINLIT